MMLKNIERFIVLTILVLFMSTAQAMYFEVSEFEEDLADFTADREFVQDSQERVCAALKIDENLPYDISIEETVYETKNIDGYNYLFFSISEPHLTVLAEGFDPLSLSPPDHSEFITGKVYYLAIEAQEKVDVNFNIDPDDTEVIIDGLPWAGERIIPGEYTIELIRPGYEERSETIALDQPEHTFTYQMNPMTFYVSISTEPADAEVYIDGMHWQAETGVLEPGSYIVHVTKEGYQDIEDMIEIVDNDVAFTYTLIPE